MSSFLRLVVWSVIALWAMFSGNDTVLLTVIALSTLQILYVLESENARLRR
jgi:hypothetical protein